MAMLLDNPMGDFVRQGDIKSLESYPDWVRKMVADTAPDRERIVSHPLFRQMRDASLSPAAMRAFLIGVWPTIEQFPQFMAMSLLKARYGRSRGEDMARQYLIKNIRIENRHADHWRAWAEASGVSFEDLLHTPPIAGMHALAHWCWTVCDTEDLAVAMAATNYAVEGATGDWSSVVCSQATYANVFPEHKRHAAMRWLRLHADYDDVHPWEALDIIATLLGQAPCARAVERVTQAVRTSWQYMALAADVALAQS